MSGGEEATEDKLFQGSWKSCWSPNREGEPRFHASYTHPDLENFFGSSFESLRKEYKSVLVPLCGKSVDMIYLARKGLNVVGVEFVEQAVIEFATDHDITWDSVIQENEFFVYSCNMVPGTIQIYLGNFFTFSAPVKFDLVYDRAAFMAIHPTLRDKYVDILYQTGKEVLIEAAEVPERDSAPYTVPIKEVYEKFSSRFQINFLAEKDFSEAFKEKFVGRWFFMTEKDS